MAENGFDTEVEPEEEPSLRFFNSSRAVGSRASLGYTGKHIQRTPRMEGTEVSAREQRGKMLCEKSELQNRKVHYPLEGERFNPSGMSRKKSGVSMAVTENEPSLDEPTNIVVSPEKRC
jgi:hypothetical protein